MSARYLLRFDDLCPTMDRAKWQRFEQLIERFGLKPILAIVPDNQDKDLVCDSPDATFWEKMRRLEQAGATIGLHGYRHVCAAWGMGLLPLHARTEFAGVVEGLQRDWIRAGLGILRDHGLAPQIWVAPRHGFDPVTLRVLHAEGIGLVSDGFAVSPFRDHGMTWIPQQLWGPKEKSRGVWTICLHANTASDASVAELERFLERLSSQFTSVDKVMEGAEIRDRSFSDRVFHARLMGRIRFDRARKRVRARLSSSRLP